MTGKTILHIVLLFSITTLSFAQEDGVKVVFSGTLEGSPGESFELHIAKTKIDITTTGPNDQTEFGPFESWLPENRKIPIELLGDQNEVGIFRMSFYLDKGLEEQACHVLYLTNHLEAANTGGGSYGEGGSFISDTTNNFGWALTALSIHTDTSQEAGEGKLALESFSWYSSLGGSAGRLQIHESEIVASNLSPAHNFLSANTQ